MIGPRNKYAIDLIGETKLPTFSTGNVDVNELSQYIASSILVHSFDGWNFISRSFDALFAGDAATAIHMAYYSELRGAMSILASEGIGVFNRKHLFFDHGNVGIVFTQNSANKALTTHLAAKELMDEWASLANKKQVVFDCIQVNNRSLTEWITASGHSTTSGYASSLLGEWLRLWSIDLKLDVDQQLRNETSYRPHYSIPSPHIKERLNEVMDIWINLEPGDGSYYQSLDTHLLRLSLESLFKMSTGRTHRHRTFTGFIDSIFNNLGESKEQILYEFLFRRTSPHDNFLLAEAKKDALDPSVNFTNPMPLICRAIILQRFATGIAKIIYTKSKVNFANLKFWWQDAAFKYGLISENPSDLTPIDLYSDVADSIKEIQENATPVLNIKEINGSIIGDVCNLKQFQRICFWGMGL